MTLKSPLKTVTVTSSTSLVQDSLNNVCKGCPITWRRRCYKSKAPRNSQHSPLLHRKTLKVNSMMSQEPEQVVGSNSRESKSLDDSLLSPGDVVQGKFRILQELGSGSNGTTYEAELVEEDGIEQRERQVVALKGLSLRSSRDWKALELFEREARVLAQLEHPNIPAYLDYFEVDTPTDRLFYIAQKKAPGKNLQDLVESGWRVTESEAVRITCELLDVLQYLGDLRPPVIHRDIKPSNIILDRESGQVSLVDFGAVAGLSAAGQMGSTIVGTYGYMSPEQFRGEVTPVSDIYGVGCCLLFLLTGMSPSEFPQSRLKIDFSSVTVSSKVKSVLARLLEPLAEDRIQSSATAAAMLRGEAPPAGLNSASGGNQTVTRGKFRRPAGTKVELSREGDDRLVVKIPAKGLTGDSVATGGFALVWNAFTASWTVAAVTGGGGLLFAAFSLPFWLAGYNLAKQAVEPIFEDARLEIDTYKFRITSKGLGEGEEIAGLTSDLQGVSIKTEMIVNGEPQTVLQLTEGVRSHNFGSGLTFTEKQWMQQEIRAFLSEAPIVQSQSY